MKKFGQIMITALLLNCATAGNTAGGGRSGSWSLAEQKATADFIAASLYDYLHTSKATALLEVTGVQNRSMRHIDTTALADDVMIQLAQKKIRFIDRNKRKEALSEIAFGQTGAVDDADAIPVGKLKSPNYLLEGTITESSRMSGTSKIITLVVSFKLTKLSTTEIVWQQKKEFETQRSSEQYSW